MKTHFLLPNKYKVLGWVLFITGLICGLLMYIFGIDDQLMTTKVFSLYSDPFMGEAGFFKIIENSVIDEIIAIAIIVGGLIVGFTKEKVEDEFIYKLRKDSLVWP